MTTGRDVRLTRSRPRSILVTGMPRSGTTWLSRLLALSAGASMPGREPMNARGRQYALAGTLRGWTRLTAPTPRQRRALERAYTGRTPWVYSRYGVDQWAAPLPRTRVIVKDPFALLSIPAVTAVTGARAVLVYRHPGAVLASYQRMGWRPKVDEFSSIVDGLIESGVTSLTPLPRSGTVSDAALFASVWSALHELAMADIEGTDALVVSHAQLAGGGVPAGRALVAELGLTWEDAMSSELEKESGTVAAHALHNLDRAPAEVAEAWRRTLSETDLLECERRSEQTREALRERTLRLE